MLHILRKYIIIFTFPISTVTYLYAQDIIFFLFGSGYTVSVTMLKIVVWFLCGFSLTVVNTRLLIVNEKENQVVLLFFISGILTLILNLILTPRFGIIFVAYIRLLTAYIMFILSTIFLFFQGYKFERPKNYIKILLACLIMIITANVFNSHKPFLGSIVSLTVYILFILVFGVITPKDMKLWKSIFSNFVIKSF
jgi:O-antigen/teichoic acid export membrane protein